MIPFGFLLLIAHLYMEVIVQNKTSVFACPFHTKNHEIEQRDVWNYLKKKTKSWKAELNDWVGEFENLVGPPDPIMFEDPSVGRWVDPLTSWEVIDYRESETTTQREETSIFYGNNGTIELIKIEVNGNTSKHVALKSTVTKNLTEQQTVTTTKSVLPISLPTTGRAKALTTIISDYGESKNPQSTEKTPTVTSDYGESKNPQSTERTPTVTSDYGESKNPQSTESTPTVTTSVQSDFSGSGANEIFSTAP